MSIVRSMQTGASGIRAHGEALAVTGDNIANVNTVGFKRSRSVFEDELGRSVVGGSAIPQAGSGARLGHIQQMWSQGALLVTGAPTDLALSGDGFFVVRGNVNGVDGNFFTRAGQFRADANGQLINPNGLNLQGYQADETGRLASTVSDLRVATGTVPAVATATISMDANLDATAVAPAAWDPTNPAGTSNFATTATVYDSLGAPHEATVYFRKSAANSWEWHAMVDGGELTGGTAGVPTEGASGTVTFDTSGALDTETTTASSWNFLDAAAAQTIAFDFGESITTDGGTGLEGLTQFASSSAVTALTQDGYAAGSVAGVAIESDGTVTGVFTNGQRRTLGQIVVADFASVDGLQRAGEGLYASSVESGEPLVGTAGTGGRGSISAGSLEGSNVDLGSEFVDMIAYQRAFQANSRVITTADEMYSELVNLKR